MSSKFWDHLAPGRKPKPPKPVPVDPVPVEPTNDSALVPGRLTRIPGPFHPRLYSDKANSWVAPDGRSIYTFGGHVERGAELYCIYKGQLNEVVKPLPLGVGTTENWYWDRNGWLYVPVNNRLHHYDPLGSDSRIAFEVPSGELWQCHSTDDGTAHSATLRQEGGLPITVVSKNGETIFFGALGYTLDESQISRDGSWLMIKETDADKKLWNRFIQLVPNGLEYQLPPGESIGHSDWHFNFVYGADAWNGHAVRYNPFTRERIPIFPTWNMGHVSTRSNYVLWSRQETGALWLGIDTLAPNKIFTHGVTSDEYDLQVRANLSPCGRVATFTLDNDLCVLEL